jgi:hypothetical protein
MGRARLAGVLVAAAVAATVLGGGRTASAGPRPDPATPARPALAAYEWRGLGQLTRPSTSQRLRFLQSQGFTTVYVDLGEYLDAADRPKTPARQALLRRLAGNLGYFVAEAARLGLTVHAVGAAPTWTDPDLRYLGPKLVRLVGQYNATAPPAQRLRGVQLDIEPYVDPDFFDDPQHGLLAYLDTMRDVVASYRQVRARPGNQTLRLGVAIPFWFDGEADAPGPVPFDGATKPAAFHLVDMLADLAHAYLVVMAYRNFTAGEDGSIRLLRSEFDYLASAGARCGLVVGQEYTEEDPPRVTFHGLGRGVFRAAAAEIAAAYGHRAQFGGVSVNDVDAYMAADE